MPHQCGSRKKPRVLRKCTFQLAGGEFLSVAMAQNLLERLLHRAQKAMKEAPPPARRAQTAQSRAKGTVLMSQRKCANSN